MKPDGRNDYLLSTGKRIPANAGRLSLGPDLIICEGYDSEVVPPTWSDTAPLTVSERQEIAAFMVDLWNRWGVGEPPMEEVING